MNITEAISILKIHQEWRLGADIVSIEPKELTEAMQVVIDVLNPEIIVGMTPKEKAIELVDQFLEHTVEWDNIKEIAYDSEYHAKQFALIAVEECLGTCVESMIYYWVEVKHELNKSE